VNRTMKIPMRDLARSDAQPQLIECMAQVVRSGQWLNGCQTQSFSIEFAEYLGVEHFLCLANGTDALEIALRTVGCGEDSDVLTVANAGGYTTAACHLVRATPVYVDVDIDTLLMDITAVPSAIGERTKAIVVTHLYGRLVDVEALRKILDSAGRGSIAVIEDCAHAHGGTLRQRKAGSLGDLAAFSFYPTKNLGACGDAGGIATRDARLFELARRLHQYGWACKHQVETSCGRNSRMDEIQAAVLRLRLTRLESENARRRSIIATYRRSGSDAVLFPQLDAQLEAAHLAVARVSDRDRFRRHMAEQRIATDVHYPMLDCDQLAWRQSGRAAHDLIRSRQAVSEIVSVPCFPEMTDDEVERVSRAISSFAAG
jgi:dTDP-3-amino-2,3,6-trideoxy-4-keto-D-glucose/dTDP-3-amino-3,4,6-trideoxy-alpha-D-glucose/dTDP-2,6-dideoxy-D-kanosamine transaminase